MRTPRRPSWFFSPPAKTSVRGSRMFACSPFLIPRQNRAPRALFKERRIEVRAVNLRMAQHARLEKARLVVERRRSRRPAEAGLRVALQAEQVYVAQLQHVGIRSAMHQMAGLAAINLHRLMLEYKRSLLVRVAREADRILGGRSAHLLGFHRAVQDCGSRCTGSGLRSPDGGTACRTVLFSPDGRSSKARAATSPAGNPTLSRGAANGRRCN